MYALTARSDTPRNRRDSIEQDVKRNIEHRKRQGRALHDPSAGPSRHPPGSVVLQDEMRDGDDLVPAPDTTCSKTTLEVKERNGETRPTVMVTRGQHGQPFGTHWVGRGGDITCGGWPCIEDVSNRRSGPVRAQPRLAEICSTSGRIRLPMIKRFEICRRAV